MATTLKQSLRDLVEHDEHGRPRLTFALPDATALDNLTNVLARLLAQTQSTSESVADLLPKSALQTPEIAGKRGAQTLESNVINAF